MVPDEPFRQPLLFIAGAAYPNDLERPSPTGSTGSRRGSRLPIQRALPPTRFAPIRAQRALHIGPRRRNQAANKPTLLHSRFIKYRGPRH